MSLHIQNIRKKKTYGIIVVILIRWDVKHGEAIPTPTADDERYKHCCCCCPPVFTAPSGRGLILDGARVQRVLAGYIIIRVHDANLGLQHDEEVGAPGGHVLHILRSGEDRG